jgi:hypothetical protein
MTANIIKNHTEMIHIFNNTYGWLIFLFYVFDTPSQEEYQTVALSCLQLDQSCQFKFVSSGNSCHQRKEPF